MNEYVNDVFNLAKQVIQATGKFVWLGIPRPPEPKSQITIAEYTGYANQYLNTFVVPIRDKLKALMASNGYDYYYNYVQGFYMSDEHVRRKTFTYPDASGENEDDPNGVDTNTSNLLAHPQIKMYSIISDKLENLGIWLEKILVVSLMLAEERIHDTTFIDIAYIANTTDIFDTVLIQPGVFFHYNPDRDPGSASVLKNLGCDPQLHEHTGSADAGCGRQHQQPGRCQAVFHQDRLPDGSQPIHFTRWYQWYFATVPVRLPANGQCSERQQGHCGVGPPFQLLLRRPKF